MSASNKKKLRKELESAQLTEKQLAQQKEAKKSKTQTIVFVSVLALILVLAIAIYAVNTFNGSGIKERATDALTVGSHTLSNADLNYFFVDTINREYTNLYAQYGSYASWFLGFDPSAPLNEQTYDDVITYADYYLDQAIDDAKKVYTVYDTAVAANHTCTEEELAEIDATFDGIKAAAKANGVSFNRYLKAMYGKGANKSNFKNYLNVITLVNSYQTNYHDSLTYDDAAIDAYNKEHFDEFSSFDYVTFLVDYEDFLTGGSKDENGKTVYSDKEKKDALTAAEEVAKALVETKADSKKALDDAIKATDKYKNDSSATATESTDSLYTSINENIAEWLADNDRKAGDITYLDYFVTSTDAEGVEIETVEGYYIVIMLDRVDNNQQLVDVRHILVKPTQNSTSEDGTNYSSEEEWDTAEKKANDLLNEWLAGDKTEDSFAKLADEKTEDDGSKGLGGLYEDVTPGAMVEAFDEWIFDSSRKAGDTDVVETEYGYHVMYFVGHTDETYREHMITSDMREDDYQKWYDGIVENATATVIDASLVEMDLVFANRMF